MWWVDISQVGAGLRNYQHRLGCLPPVQERDAQGRPLHSWRVLILEEIAPQGYDDPELASLYNRSEAWDGPNNRESATEYFGPTTCLAVVGEDGNWLRSTAGSNPVRLIEGCGAPVPWIEPRDLTVDEAYRAIHVPMPSGSLVHRLTCEPPSPPEYPAVLADGEEFWIPVHAPPTIVRAAILGDRAKQKELKAYRELSRMRWTDYLTATVLMASWIAMVQTWPRRRPAAAQQNKIEETWVA